ncbi:MAG: LysR family transcriptional regulator [Gammaproteobacteria bacterium]
MDTEVLKTFLEVNRTRHFGKAAGNLFITQSAVSARVRQLEEAVGVALFFSSPTPNTSNRSRAEDGPSRRDDTHGLESCPPGDRPRG